MSGLALLTFVLHCFQYCSVFKDDLRRQFTVQISIKPFAVKSNLEIVIISHKLCFSSVSSEKKVTQDAVRSMKSFNIVLRYKNNLHTYDLKNNAENFASSRTIEKTSKTLACKLLFGSTFK